ncbi:unnamed protein product [Symbiodinium necroappetens]|uniref:Uncharacterized protein n=1 Tax=Symbiodinium necroappetens TaxID=1628268 RepID=A0A812NF87_9DINO|nr:unnamed protein product [Symbiodinium necroappetens]
MDVEILLETAEEQCKRRSRGPRSLFAISYLTVAEDWDEAVPRRRSGVAGRDLEVSIWRKMGTKDRRGEELVRASPQMSWAIALSRRFCSIGRLPGLRMNGHRAGKGPQVMEMVLRNLALRIKDRDAETLKRFEQALAVSNTQDHAVGTRLVVSMAKEVLEWSKSGPLGLWLKDAELYAGEKGRNQASALLRAAADSLDGEVRGLGHTQSFRIPRAEDDSPAAAVDRSITKGVRLVHFGCFEQAQEQLDEARLRLQQQHFEEGARESLTLAACLASSLLQQKKGRNDLVKELKAECTQSLHRLEATTKRPKPVACWHNLPLLLRVLPSSKRPSSPMAQRHGDLDWSGMECTGALDSDVLEDLPDSGLQRRVRARSRHLMSYLMPLTGERFASDALEVHRIEAGLAKALC